VSEWRVRRRTRLKQKEMRALREQMQGVFGEVELWPEAAAVESGEVADHQVVIVDGVVHGLVREGMPFLSVRGLLAYRPATRFVTVDMGAVRFVHNGADVMAPGIVGADPELKEGDWCWIRDERNQQPLGVGVCRMTGPAMVAERAGKAVQSVHHLGDKLWDLDAGG
jgi:PUA-domain protein